MADVTLGSFYSFPFSSSTLIPFASSLNSLQPVLPAVQSNSEKIVYPVSFSSAGTRSHFVRGPRKQLLSFKHTMQLALRWIPACGTQPCFLLRRAAVILDADSLCGIINNNLFHVLFQVHATVAETKQSKWWEKNAGPNMIDIHSTQEYLSALSRAGDRLVIVEFYGTWCASCRALLPKLCRTAEEHPEISFLKVNFDENILMCKSLNVKVLPYFHFYRGADGQVESFSCSLAKFQKIKDAIAQHNTECCSLDPPRKLKSLLLNLSLESAPKDSH